MRTRGGPPCGTVLPGLIIMAGFALTLLMDWPGHLSYDSVLQLLQGRTGVYNTWHPPVMAWLLGIGDAVVRGASLFVIFQALFSFGTLLSLLAFDQRKPKWPSVVVLSTCIALPQFLLYQGIVWKDVLFADTAVAGFVCLAHVARVWPKPVLRKAMILLATVLLVLAALTRQNGLILLPLGAAALGCIAAKRSATRRTAIAFGVAQLAAATILVAAATIALNTRSDGDSGPREQFDLLQAYDLSGAVAAEQEFPLTNLARAEPRLAHLIRSEGARLYTPVRSDPIAASLPLMTELRKADVAALGADWRALILRHPMLYLANRARVFWWVLATPDIFQCRPIFAGVEGPPAALKALDMTTRLSPRDNALRVYGAFLLDTPAFSHLAFGAVALLVLVLLVRRRRAEDIALAFLLLAAFAFAASFFVISIACDYRYLYFLDLSALVALVYVSLDIRSALRGSP
jgi:hypothetical protein